MYTASRRSPAVGLGRTSLFVERLETRSAPSGFDLGLSPLWASGGLAFAHVARDESPAGVAAPAEQVLTLGTPADAGLPGQEIGLPIPGDLRGLRFVAVPGAVTIFTEPHLLGAVVSVLPTGRESLSQPEGGTDLAGVEEGPVITNFIATSLPDPNRYLLKGDVEGEGVIGQPVWFGGLPTLDGPPQLTTTVVLGDYGAAKFSLAVTLGQGEYGVATAQTQDDQGRLSNVAETLI